MMGTSGERGETEGGLGERSGSRASLCALGPWAVTSETAGAALRGGGKAGGLDVRPRGALLCGGAAASWGVVSVPASMCPLRDPSRGGG